MHSADAPIDLETENEIARGSWNWNLPVKLFPPARLYYRRDAASQGKLFSKEGFLSNDYPKNKINKNKNNNKNLTEMKAKGTFYAWTFI